MIAEAPTSPATEEHASVQCHCPTGSAAGECSPHSTTLPLCHSATSLFRVALALLNPTLSYDQIAADNNITPEHLLALFNSPELHQLLNNLAAVETLRRQQYLAAANQRALARLVELTETNPDPAEQRRAATAITRARATDRSFVRSVLPTSAPAATPPQRSNASPPTPPDHRNATTSLPPRPLPVGELGVGSAPSNFPETRNDPAPAFPNPKSQTQNPQSPSGSSTPSQSAPAQADCLKAPVTSTPHTSTPHSASPPRLPTPPLPHEPHRSLSPAQVVLATLAQFKHDKDPDALCTLYNFSTINFRSDTTHPMTFASRRRNLLHPLAHLRRVTAFDITQDADRAAVAVDFIRKDGIPYRAAFGLLRSTNRTHYHNCWLMDSITITPTPSAPDTS